MLIARNLNELAERIAHRTISTLELLSDSDFDDGLAALRKAASQQPSAPVYSPNELLVLTT